MAELTLSAKLREILGRKVKTLRKEGLVPAHVFGHNVKTIHVSVTQNDFEEILAEAGETTIVNLKTNGEKRPVLIRGVQTHPVTDKILHIDFYQVSLKEKVKVEVPLEIVGESSAVEKKLGVLLTPVLELEVEALPQDLPEKIEVDIAKLENVGDAIHVKDLKVDKAKVELQADPELVVANIGELVTKEAEEILAEEEAERAEAAAEEVAEEAVAAEEEEKAEEKAAEAPAEEKVEEKAEGEKEE